MNWYLVKIVFRIICGDGQHTPQFDEQLRLAKADSIEEAFLKMKERAESEELSFMNNNQQLVQWKFINISEVFKLGELIDGAEIYSRVEECDDAKNYIDLVNHKASSVFHADLHEHLHLV